MKPKTLFALFGLLFLLFACSLLLGLLNAGRPVGEIPPPAIESLAALLVRERPLQADDITQANPAACLQQFQQGQFVIPAGLTCTFVVDEGSPSLRTLTLRLVQGGTAEATLQPAGDTNLPARHTLNAAQPQATIQLFEEGGLLSVACLNSGGSIACGLQIDD
jgi:hypothetical protein